MSDRGTGVFYLSVMQQCNFFPTPALRTLSSIPFTRHLDLGRQNDRLLAPAPNTHVRVEGRHRGWPARSDRDSLFGREHHLPRQRSSSGTPAQPLPHACRTSPGTRVRAARPNRFSASQCDRRWNRLVVFCRLARSPRPPRTAQRRPLLRTQPGPTPAPPRPSRHNRVGRNKDISASPLDYINDWWDGQPVLLPLLCSSLCVLY
jgi:hypothetical protein